MNDNSKGSTLTDNKTDTINRDNKTNKTDNNNNINPQVTIPNQWNLSDIPQDSEIYPYVSQTVPHGPIHKRMFLCPCFYHERYFLLLNTGVLLYCSKNKKIKGKINLTEEIEVIRRVKEESESFKVFMKYKDGSVESLRWDTEEIR